jgi:flagellar hook-associated protein 3 FlgL
MRVTSDTLRSAFLSALEQAQRRIVDTQNQVTTGRRINTPSDDPVAAARIAALDASLTRLDQYRSNTQIARNQLGLEEEALASAIDNFQRVRELAVQANNAPLNDGDRAAIASELRAHRDTLLSIANSTDATGNYLFAGYSEKTQPFTGAASGSVAYNGDQGQRSVQIADGRFVAIGDSGAEIFQRIQAGNGTFTLAISPTNTGGLVLGAGTIGNPTAWVPDTYTIEFPTPDTYRVLDGTSAEIVPPTAYAPGQDIAFLGVNVELSGAPAAGDAFTVAASSARNVFATLDSLIAVLEQPASGTAARSRMHSEVAQLITDVDRATEHVIDKRSEIGSRVRTLDQEESLNEDFSTQLTATLSDIRDLDYAEALSRLSQQLFSLEAAQQTYSRTQNLSLFRYL